MIRILLIIAMLLVAVPVSAQEQPGESQRRALDGMTASDGIGPLMVEIYGATPAQGGYPPLRYFSARLQALILTDKARPSPRVPSDWLRRADMPWPDDRFRAYALNTTGAHDGRPASAAVGLWFDQEQGWGRRFHLIDHKGHWVIDGVCMSPGGSLDRMLTTPGPTEPDDQPRPDGASC